MAVTTINIDSQVLTFANLAAFPVTGTVKTIYIAEDTNFQYYWDGSQYVLLTTDINIPANLIFYATTAPSSVPGYERLVISPDDVDYDNPAVDVPTGAITTTAQLVGEQVADADIFAGNPGVINISTIGEIRRTSGTGTAEFYFEVYQRTSLGVETLRGTSNKTVPISGGVYQQFQVDCLFNNGTWLSTDRVVIKFYADRVVGGSNPNYDFLFGGANPVRTLFPISAQLLLNVPIAIGITGVTGGVTNQVLITDGSGKLGQSELKTVNSNSLLGSGDVSVGTVTSIATAGLLSGGTITSSGTITTSINTNRLVGRSTAGVGVMEEITIGSGLTLSGGTLTAAGGGITIGTTAIASGTVNGILFQGAGDVVQQDSTFVWNNTDKRLILGTEAVADANTRLVITGSGSGSSTTTFGLKVHNSTGTNNALSVRDDGRVNVGGGRLHVGNATATGRIWFGNAASPTGANNGYIDLDNTSSATGSIFNIPGTDSNNETTRITIQHRDRADGVRIYPAITGGTSANVNKTVIGKSTGAGNTFGIDFRFYGTTSNTTGGTSEAYRFYSYDAINPSTTNLLRFQIGNGALITTSFFVNSQIGITDNNSITVNSSAVLDLQSTTKGFLPPRMTTAQRDLISSPATGLTLYNTTTNTLDIKSSAASVFNRFGSETLIVGGGNTQATIALSVQNNSTNNNSFIVSDLGNIGIGTTSAGTSATKTLVINNGIAPTGDVTDSFQQYSADIVAGNAAPHFRTENGDVVRIYRVGGWGLPTGSFTRTTFDTTTVTLQQLAERVAALIQDLRDNHQLLKA